MFAERLLAGGPCRVSYVCAAQRPLGGPWYWSCSRGRRGKPVRTVVLRIVLLTTFLLPQMGELQADPVVSPPVIESANDDQPGSGEVGTCHPACVVGQGTGGPVFTFALGVSSWIERRGLPLMVQSIIIGEGWSSISLLPPGGRALGLNPARPFPFFAGSVPILFRSSSP